MKKVLFTLPLIVVFALGLLLWRGLSVDSEEIPSALVGKAMPEFDLPILQQPGEYVGASIFQGEVSLLNVWATWCTACKYEHPYLMELAENRDIRIIGLDYKDDRDAALKWLEDLGDPYAITLYDSNGTLGFELGVYGAPETFLVDPDGIIRVRHAGVVDEKVWQEKFLPIYQQF